MSRQKFASNVVEKCLTFGTPGERNIIVNEMLGSTNENGVFRSVMMKDQFANYVTHKLLESCDDHNLELILNRIKVHLNALKKYTYKKHIVAHVDKLAVTGDTRMVYVIPYSTRDMECHSLRLSASIAGVRLGRGMNCTEALFHQFGILRPGVGPGEGLSKELNVLISFAIACNYYDGPTCQHVILGLPCPDEVPCLSAKSLGHPVIRSDSQGKSTPQ
ncbi:hypothetical protein RHSIM_Rhsim07G0135200 [Rhododendron simsii]|uniref:PUM-HD domain-containing protein n=1 Tax=Rhododendron simsii TaxID=118357 RepID=A0A834LFV2_RHOSS|nr:hypothetical protein RHSIM_Rhsim07G0135200 [Rhododendron simsii]